MSDIDFTCVCGSTTFESDKPIKSMEDFVGSKCTECHREATEEDVITQARELAEAAIRNVLKGFKP